MPVQGDADKGSQRSASVRLRILATTDLHANLQPYNYYADKPSDDVGLARTASLIARMRAEEENCLLLDNGDTLQGTPLGDYAVYERAGNGRPHPVIEALNTLGYDAATLGNHDFNYGLQFLETALADAAYPVVLANITRASGSAFLPPSVLLRRHLRDATGAMQTVAIGIIGVAPPQILKWDRQLLEGSLVAEDILPAATREVARLREQGADVVIALCHSGIGPTKPKPDMENAAHPLAALTGIDALVAGHTHDTFPNTRHRGEGIDPEHGTIHGTPVVQPGFWGSHLGVIDMTLVPEGDGWTVTAGTGRVLSITDANGAAAVLSHQPVMRVTAADHTATLGYIRRRLGETTAPLNSYFALISNAASVQVVADAQRGHAEILLRDHPLVGLPLISAAAPFKAGGRGGSANFSDVPAGPLSIRNASDLYMFPNALNIVEATGARLADWLERSACAFHQITPGSEDHLLIDHRFAGYNFDVLDGLSYEIDVSVPARFSADGEIEQDSPGRIRALCHNGTPVAPDARFLVVTNSYRAAGGGHFPAAAACPPVADDQTSVRDVLIRHIATHSPLSPEPAAIWRFAPLGGTRVIVETGPGALGHPTELERLGMAHVGESDAGFARFTLTL